MRRAAAGRGQRISAPAKYVTMYQGAFGGIGVDDVRGLRGAERSAVDAAGGVFLTGGTQKRLVDAIRDTPLHDALRELVARGGVIAGTSAGASALGETMLSGTEDPQLTTGLGLLPHIMIDQHFAERDRIGRLTAGMARVRLHTGVGIDEDTALVVRGDHATVIGAGCVSVLESGRLVRLLRSGDDFTLGDTIAA